MANIEEALGGLINKIKQSYPEDVEVDEIVRVWGGSGEDLYDHLAEKYFGGEEEEEEEEEVEVDTLRTTQRERIDFLVRLFYDHYGINGEDEIDEQLDAAVHSGVDTVLNSLCGRYRKPPSHWTGPAGGVPAILTSFYHLNSIPPETLDTLIDTVAGGAATLPNVLSRLCTNHTVPPEDWALPVPPAMLRKRDNPTPEQLNEDEDEEEEDWGGYSEDGFEEDEEEEEWATQRDTKEEDALVQHLENQSAQQEMKAAAKLVEQAQEVRRRSEGDVQVHQTSASDNPADNEPVQGPEAEGTEDTMPNTQAQEAAEQAAAAKAREAEVEAQLKADAEAKAEARAEVEAQAKAQQAQAEAEAQAEVEAQAKAQLRADAEARAEAEAQQLQADAEAHAKKVAADQARQAEAEAREAAIQTAQAQALTQQAEAEAHAKAIAAAQAKAVEQARLHAEAQAEAVAEAQTRTVAEQGVDREAEAQMLAEQAAMLEKREAEKQQEHQQEMEAAMHREQQQIAEQKEAREREHVRLLIEKEKQELEELRSRKKAEELKYEEMKQREVLLQKERLAQQHEVVHPPDSETSNEQMETIPLEAPAPGDETDWKQYTNYVEGTIRSRSASCVTTQSAATHSTPAVQHLPAAPPDPFCQSEPCTSPPVSVSPSTSPADPGSAAPTPTQLPLQPKVEGVHSSFSTSSSKVPPAERTPSVSFAEPDPVAPTGEVRVHTDCSVSDEWRARIEDIYKECNPEKLGDIDNLLAQYAGHELELYDAIVQKYKADGNRSRSPSSSAVPPPVLQVRSSTPPIRTPEAPVWTPPFDEMHSRPSRSPMSIGQREEMRIHDVVTGIHSVLWGRRATRVNATDLVRCLEEEGAVELAHPLLMLLDPQATGVIHIDSWVRLLGTAPLAEAASDLRSGSPSLHHEVQRKRPARKKQTLHNWYEVKGVNGKVWLKNRKTGEKLLKGTTRGEDPKQEPLPPVRRASRSLSPRSKLLQQSEALDGADLCGWDEPPGRRFAKQAPAPQAEKEMFGMKGAYLPKYAAGVVRTRRLEASRTRSSSCQTVDSKSVGEELPSYHPYAHEVPHYGQHGHMHHRGAHYHAIPPPAPPAPAVSAPAPEPIPSGPTPAEQIAEAMKNMKEEQEAVIRALAEKQKVDHASTLEAIRKEHAKERQAAADVHAAEMRQLKAEMQELMLRDERRETEMEALLCDRDREVAHLRETMKGLVGRRSEADETAKEIHRREIEHLQDLVNKGSDKAVRLEEELNRVKELWKEADRQTASNNRKTESLERALDESNGRMRVTEAALDAALSIRDASPPLGQPSRQSATPLSVTTPKVRPPVSPAAAYTPSEASPSQPLYDLESQLASLVSEIKGISVAERQTPTPVSSRRHSLPPPPPTPPRATPTQVTEQPDLVPQFASI